MIRFVLLNQRCTSDNKVAGYANSKITIPILMDKMLTEED